MSADAPILLLGGTGYLGRHIVQSLLAKGVPVRVLSRDAERAREVLGAEAGIVQGDITSRPDVTRALSGARALVISISAFNPRLIKKLELIERDAVLTALEEAAASDVSRVVYISTYDIRMDMAEVLKLSIAQAKLEVERALACSKLAWTVLGAAPSSGIFFAMIRGNTMIVPGGGPPALPTIAPADVGEVAAQTVLREDLAGKRIRMVGPEAVSFPEAARRISAVWGREIRFRKIPLLPLRIASRVVAPFNPYLQQLFASILLMNAFPQDLVAQAEEDHQYLLETFRYEPTTLEMEARDRREGG